MTYRRRATRSRPYTGAARRQPCHRCKRNTLHHQAPIEQRWFCTKCGTRASPLWNLIT